MAEQYEPKEGPADCIGQDGSVDASVEQIMERIRKALYFRGAEALVEASDDRGDQEVPAALRRSSVAEIDPELYRSLSQANTIAMGGLQVQYELGWRTPIVGHVWMAVRRRIHQEIRIYIDAILAQQVSLNSQLVRAISRLAEGIRSTQLASRLSEAEAQADGIRALREEVGELRERIDQLERERLEASGVR